MLSAEWLSAFAPIGALHGRDRWLGAGAGILFTHGGAVWVVTANHVVEQVGEKSIALMLSRSSARGVVIVEIGAVHAQAGLGWVRDAKNDLACALVPTSPDVRMKAVSKDLCVPLAELMPSQQAFTVGCPYGVHGLDPDSATPLVLGGVVSGTNAREGVIYTSAPTFPGNSGGPLIVVRSPFDAAGNMVVGRPTVLLAGIVLQSALVSSPNAEDRLPPLHLGVARSSDAILALLGSADATAQLSRIPKA